MTHVPADPERNIRNAAEETLDGSGIIDPGHFMPGILYFSVFFRHGFFRGLAFGRGRAGPAGVYPGMDPSMVRCAPERCEGGDLCCVPGRDLLFRVFGGVGHQRYEGTAAK